MTNAFMSRSSMLKALLALIILVTVAWQIPFSTFAEGEGEVAASTLSVSCAGSPTPAEPGEHVTWNSNVSGGTGQYTYAWTGNGSFAANATNGVNGSSVETFYWAAGIKHANLTVTSGAESKTVGCTDVEVLEDQGGPLAVTCSASPNPGFTDDEVTWTAHPSGGNGNYWYAWTGTGNFPGPQHTDGKQSVTATYQNEGEREATVTITSGNSAPVSATCKTQIVANPNPPPTTCAEPTEDWEIRAIRDQMQFSFDLDAGTASVTNPTNCDYPFALKAFQVYSDPAHQIPQTLFDSDEKIVPAGATRTFDVDVPSCRYQLDLVIFPGTGYTSAKLLRGQIKMGLNLCPIQQEQPLQISCTGAPDPALPLQLVTWASQVSGGTGQYTYSWTGNGSFSENATTTGVNGPLVKTFYWATGGKQANLTVTSGTQSQTVQCSIQVTDNPPTCPSSMFNPSVDLVDALGNPFNPWDGSSISRGDSGTMVTVHNRSTVCSYNVALSSYQVGEPIDPNAPDQNAEYHRFINEQTHVASDPRYHVGPGQTVTLQVPVPACNWQSDLYAFVDGGTVGPVPPDFAALEQAGTHDLLDWLVEATPGNSCFEQCPAQPTITSVAPTGTFSVGQSYSYTVTTSGGTPPISISINPVGPGVPGLVAINGTLSGTIGAGASGTYTYEVTAQGSGGGPLSCAAVQRFTITVGGVSQCPAKPTITSTPQTTAVIGGQYNYSVTTSGGVAPVSVSIVANGPGVPGLSINGATLSGTIGATATGTYSYTVKALSAGSVASCAVAQTFSITIGGSCPFIPPVFEVGDSDTFTGTVGVRISPYSLRLVRAEGNIVYSVSQGQLPPGLEITGNEITGIPTQATDATVVIRVANQCGSDTLTLHIIISGQCVPPKITSEGSASGTVGHAFNYSVNVSGGTPPIVISIQGTLPQGLSFSAANDTISGTPTQAGTFDVVIHAQGGSGTKICEATLPLRITIGQGGDDDDDDDNGDDDDDNGGGGHRRRPNVVLFSEPEVLGASISLSQVPYTGLGTSLLQLFLFIVGLLAISAGIVYAIMKKLRRSAEHAVVTEHVAMPVRNISAEGYDTLSVDMETGSYEEEYARTVVAPRPAPVAAQRDISQQAPVQHPAPQHIPTVPNVPAALASVSKGPETPRAQAPARMPAKIEHAPEPVIDPARIQTEARASRTLVSDDGAELIAHSAEGDEKRALERLAQVIDIAKTRYPREDGWLILDKDRVRESLFISTLSMIPLFIEWIVRAEDKKVFTFLRMLKHQEQPVADFMRKVVSELDSAHRARLEGAEERSHVNAHIAEVTYHLSNKELEAIVAELLHGVDERYDSAYTSVRLSLVRVLDMIKERMLRAVGTPYAFSGERESA